MEIYHEKQSLLLCAKHALNNILQEKAFSKDSLNKICEFLTRTKSFQLNPHRSALNLGNYDVNVIEAALIQKGYQMSWFDARQDIMTIDFTGKDNKSLLGLIINIKGPPGLQKLFLSSDQHWIAIRYLNGAVYNLDSKLKKPMVMSDNYLREYLAQILSQNGHIFLVHKIGLELEENPKEENYQVEKEMKMEDMSNNQNDRGGRDNDDGNKQDEFKEKQKIIMQDQEGQQGIVKQ